MTTVDGVTSEERNGAMARMRNAMRREGITNKNLAEILGVSEKTVRRWMQASNTSAPNIRQVYKFCRVLDINPTYLLYGLGAPRLSTVEKVARFADVVEKITAIADAVDLAAQEIGALGDRK